MSYLKWHMIKRGTELGWLLVIDDGLWIMEYQGRTLLELHPQCLTVAGRGEVICRYVTKSSNLQIQNCDLQICRNNLTCTFVMNTKSDLHICCKKSAFVHENFKFKQIFVVLLHVCIFTQSLHFTHICVW